MANKFRQWATDHGMGRASRPPKVADDELHRIVLYIYRYARRWAVTHSHDPSDAIVYDAAISVLAAVSPKGSIGSSMVPAASTARYYQYGPETPSDNYSIPISPIEATIALHRFARRYTNGRGTFTAALVNDAASLLIEAGISLQSTIDTDGTVWAADGSGGKFDGLTPAQRHEALEALKNFPDSTAAAPEEESSEAAEQ